MTYDETMSGGVYGNGAADLFVIYSPDIASAGVWANGQGLVVADYFPDLPTGGLFGNGAGNIVEDDVIVASGGVWANGSAILLVVHNPSLTPAGVKASGLAIRSASTHCPCPNCCGDFSEVMTGGCKGSGTALVDVWTITPAGLLANGSALVDVPTQIADSFSGLWLLTEQGSGIANEYKDLTVYALHGQGGSGFSTHVPTLTTGAFCRNGQLCQGSHWITFPADHVSPSQSFTVSCWASISSIYQQTTFFSRGFTDTDHNWAFSFGVNFLNFLFAEINTGSQTYYVQGQTQLTRNQTYHLTCVWDREAGQLSTYVNGILDNTKAAANNVTLTSPLNGSYASRLNSAQLLQGTIQDIRLSSLKRDNAWIKATYDNYCDPNFYEVS